MINILTKIKNKMDKQKALSRLTSLENEAKELRKIIDAPQKITDRVKTFEDACRMLYIDPEDVSVRVGSSLGKDALSLKSYPKLIIIARALNEGWEPNWNDTSQYKYYPYFDMRSGAGFSAVFCGDWVACSVFGSRLCFKTEELAKYAGKQFESIYKDFLTL